MSQQENRDKMNPQGNMPDPKLTQNSETEGLETFGEVMSAADRQATPPGSEPSFPKKPRTWPWVGLGVLVVIALLVVGTFSLLRGGNGGASTQSAPRGDAILTTFQWSWNSVADQCTKTIGPAGFGYVQISPPQETIQGTPWWTSYQPASYLLESKLGTSEEFQNMVDVCDQAGVGIIVDAVVNHMAAVDNTPGVGVAGSPFDEDDFPGLYTADDFNECRDNISSYLIREYVQGCRLVGLQDLATGQENVQDTLADYLNGFIDMGVAGFRIDAAKHIPAEDLAAIKSKLNDPEVFWVQEVIRASDEPIKPEEYVGNGKVNEFAYGRMMVDNFNNQIKNLEYLGRGLLPSADAVVFVDNHDTERNDSTLNYTWGNDYLLANIFMLAWDYGQPAVYTGYTFTNRDAGAPGVTDVSVPDVDCADEQWTCLQNWSEIRAMVEFHNQAVGTPVTNWWSNQANVIAFGRSEAEPTAGPTAPISGEGAVATVVPFDVESRDVHQVANEGSGLAFLVINNEDAEYVAGAGKNSNGSFGEGNPYADAAAGSLVEDGSLMGPRFSTSLPQGKYCNVMVPDCEEVITVDRDGSFAAQIPAGKALALHVGARK